MKYYQESSQRLNKASIDLSHAFSHFFEVQLRDCKFFLFPSLSSVVILFAHRHFIRSEFRSDQVRRLLDDLFNDSEWCINLDPLHKEHWGWKKYSNRSNPRFSPLLNRCKQVKFYSLFMSWDDKQQTHSIKCISWSKRCPFSLLVVSHKDHTAAMCSWWNTCPWVERQAVKRNIPTSTKKHPNGQLWRKPSFWIRQRKWMASWMLLRSDALLICGMSFWLSSRVRYYEYPFPCNADNRIYE